MVAEKILRFEKNRNRKQKKSSVSKLLKKRSNDKQFDLKTETKNYPATNSLKFFPIFRKKW